MKKFTSLLCGIMLCAAANIAFAQSGNTGPLQWELADGMLTITGTGAMPNFGFGASPWYANRASITGVTVAEGVTTIGEWAFYNCTALTGATISNTVTAIGGWAFMTCTALTDVTIGSLVATIGGQAFSGCSALEVLTNHAETPQTVVASVFGGVTLASCTLKVPAESVDDYEAAAVWANFGSIEAIDEGSDCDNPIASGTTGTLAWKICPDSMLTITGTGAMPNFGFGASPWYANRASITGVTVAEGVTTIGDWAFYNCTALTAATISNTVTSIGGWVFMTCTALTDVTIGSSVATIGSQAFNGCSALTAFTNHAETPQAVVTSVFAGVTLSGCTLKVPAESVDDYEAANVWKDFGFIGAIGGSTDDCTTPIGEGTAGSLAWKVCPDGTLTITGSGPIPDYAMLPWEVHANLITSAVIGEGVTRIGENAFSMCAKMTSVEIPNSVISIGRFGFHGCETLAAITLPASLTTIESNAFQFCKALTSVEIPASVTLLEDSAFFYCSALTAIEVAPSNPNYSSQDGILFNKSKTALLQCPEGKTGEYVLPDGVTSIEINAFHLSPLSSITLPNSVESIGEKAFYSSTLTSVTIGSSVTSIGTWAFGWCMNITEIINRATTPQTIDANVFGYANTGGCTLRVPAGSLALYQAADVWKDFGTIEAIDEGSEFEYITETVNGVSFDMATVAGGTFTMGATAEQDGENPAADELPTHEVTLSGFAIGKTEVTQGLWYAVMGSYPNSGPTTAYGMGDEYPLYRVTWNEAMVFISTLNTLTGKNYRLPFEAEWEYAARGGNRSEGYKYSGSNDATEVAWHMSNSQSATHPVGTLAPNELGLYDMSGNVFEFVYDWYGNYSSEAQTNPTGPQTGDYRVNRGGGRGSMTSALRVSDRNMATLTTQQVALGFRLARPLDSYTVNLSANPTEGGEIEGGGTYTAGEQVTVTATPATNYAFVNWTENSAEVSADTAYTFTVEGNRTLVANFESNEIPSPVQLVLATPNNDDTQVEVKWYAPGAAPLIEKTYTLDDGTAENGWMANPNYALQAGNQFVTTDQGTIQSIATYWQDNVNASGRQVSINIYNAGRELVGSSELFTPPANDWITVPLTSAVAFSGDFYVMVNVPAAPGATEYLGYDQNGPNAASNLDWYYDAAEGAWVNLHDAGQSPAGILTIRANAMVAGEAKSYGYAAESSNNPFNRNKEVTIQASLMNPAAPVETGNPVVTGRADSNPKALVNYSVYRLLKGQEEAEWTSLGTTVDTAYVDNTWATAPSGIYRYAVKVNYTGSTSTATQSKDVPKDMYVQVTVHLTTNSGDPVYGAMVALEHENPEYTQGLAATNSNVIFPTVWKGTYNLTVALEGFEPHSETIVVNGDMTVDVELTEIIETPYGLKVETTDTPADRQFSWNNIPEPFSDDIESYEDFIIEGIGEYILHDEDGGTPYGFGGATYPNMLEPQSWIVFNPSTVDPPFTTGSAHSPHSGTKYLACFSQQTPPNNDWLILPEIQVISGTVFSFWAKTYTASYGLERMKIAVSTTGTDPDDFTVISEGDYLSVPTAWTEYTFDLSDYAGQEIYLAINCVSNDAFFLMVDDIFVGIPAKGANAAKSFTGYTVYLDDEDEAIAEGIMETQYILTDLTVDTHRAGVKAVYSSGESEIVWTEPFTILAPEYTVTFTVTNENGEPVEGATIVFNGETLDSYIASGVTAGEYDYTVSKTGYTTATGTVEVIDQNVTEEVTLGTVGIDSNSLATIHLHPNPFTDEITVSNPAAVRNIQITDAAGQKVKEVVLESKTISTGELSSGVYFVTIETVTGEKAVYKMVKK